MQLRQLGSVLVRVLASPALLALSFGVTGAVAVLLGLSVAINTVGFSQSVVVGLLLAGGVGIDAGFRFGRLEPATRWCWRGLIGGWAFALPLLAGRTFGMFENLFSSVALSGTGGILAGLMVGLVTIAVPAFFLISEVFASHGRTERASNVAGAVAAFATAIPLAGLFASATMVALCCLAVTSALLLVQFVHARFSGQAALVERALPSDDPSMVPVWLQAFALLLAGGSVPLISRILSQTMTSSLYAVSCGVAAMTLGFALGRSHFRGGTTWLQRSIARVLAPFGSPVVAAAAFCVSLVSTVLLFPQLTQLQLHANATFDAPWLVLATRGSLTVLFLLPVGLLTGCVVKTSGSAAEYPMPALTFAGGSLLMFAVLTTGPSVSILAVVLGCTGMVVCVCLLKPTTGGWLPTGRGCRLGLVALATVVLVSPFLTSRYQPNVAARLLYSTAVFQEYAKGTDPVMLLASTDARPLSATESEVGTRSAWRTGGSMLQVRRNGAPVAVASSSPVTCPQSTTASLPVVVPMLLRAFPEDILLLGDSGPAAESTALRFPVQSVTAMHQRLRTVPELDSVFADRREDDRYQFLHAAPKVGLAGLQRQFDVVICNPPPTADLDAASFYTTDFYERIAQNVTDEGLFCQMFRQIDFGPEPMRRVLTSLSQSFSTVSAVQLGAGEIILLATNGEAIIEPGMAKRTQERATRQMLDELAWDWSRMLELASLDAESIAAITSDSTEQNTLANSSLLWSLPFETMRWGDKRTEVRQALAVYQRRIIDQLEQDDFRDEAARRIAELREEREVLFGFPDEPWVYRRTLRSRLEKHPRPAEPIVKGGTVKRRAHPTDRYRVEYFKVLANAIQQSRTSPDAIRGLDAFVAPTEPLLSYFASHEAARLLADNGEQSDAELFHRLRTVYFTPASSRSVRDLVSTINLIVDKPELIPDPADRWDRMNSLLQTMLQRWDARRDIAPTSTEVAMTDLDLCLAAFESAMSAMDTWAEDCDIDDVTLAHRSRFLRRRLENPLRGYRDKLIPHYDGAQSIAAEEDARFTPLGN